MDVAHNDYAKGAGLGESGSSGSAARVRIGSLRLSGAEEYHVRAAQGGETSVCSLEALAPIGETDCKCQRILRQPSAVPFEPNMYWMVSRLVMDRKRGIMHDESLDNKVKTPCLDVSIQLRTGPKPREQSAGYRRRDAIAVCTPLRKQSTPMTVRSAVRPCATSDERGAKWSILVKFHGVD